LVFRNELPLARVSVSRGMTLAFRLAIIDLARSSFLYFLVGIFRMELPAGEGANDP
jgi:hypothetical protein